MATESQEAAARAAASAIVASELRGPIAYVTAAVTRLQSDEHGVVQLPMQPAFNVAQVLYDTGQTQDLGTITVDGQWVSGLARLAWVTITYDHGWHEADVPQIVRHIINRLTHRLVSHPDDTLKSERIGSYEATFSTEPGWLADDECKALRRVSRVSSRTTASTSTSTSGPDRGLFGPTMNDLGWE